MKITFWSNGNGFLTPRQFRNVLALGLRRRSSNNLDCLSGSESPIFQSHQEITITPGLIWRFFQIFLEVSLDRAKYYVIFAMQICMYRKNDSPPLPRLNGTT